MRSSNWPAANSSSRSSSTARADCSVQSSLVNAGVLDHPISGQPSVAFVTYGSAKLRNLRARPHLAVTFRSGWSWATVEGRRRADRPGRSASPRRRRTATSMLARHLRRRRRSTRRLGRVRPHHDRARTRRRVRRRRRASTATDGARSHREDLRLVGERLELQGVAGRVVEEHRPLLAGLAGEAHVRLDDEFGARGAQPLGESVEVVDRRGSARSAARARRGRRPGCGSARSPTGDEWVTIWCPRKSQSTHVSALRPCAQPSVCP